MTPTITDLSHSIRDAVANTLGPGAWNALPPADRLLIEEASLDAAELQMDLLSAANDDIATARVRREKAHIDAQLASIAAVQAQAVSSALWDAAAQILLRAGVALAAA